MAQTSFEQYQRQWVTTLSAGYIEMSTLRRCGRTIMTFLHSKARSLTFIFLSQW